MKDWYLPLLYFLIFILEFDFFLQLINQILHIFHFSILFFLYDLQLLYFLSDNFELLNGWS